MIRLLIVDDHPVVRSGIRGMLATSPDLAVLGEAANGAAALELTAQLQPELVLLDLRMPDMDGITTLRQLKNSHPTIRVLILTTYEHEIDMSRALEAGADGYLLKDSPREVLIDTIQRVMQGERIFPASAANRRILSQREIEVLTLAAQGNNNREIGSMLHISEATVKSHLIHIFAKLDAADRTAAVATALTLGIIHLDC